MSQLSTRRVTRLKQAKTRDTSTSASTKREKQETTECEVVVFNAPDSFTVN